MVDNVFSKLAHRFVAWPLPADQCATDPSYAHPRHGTHLLTVAQAEAMLRYVLAGEADYQAYCQREHPEAEGTLGSLTTVATMLETYGIAELPANESGQVDFMRALMDSAVAEIRAFIAKQRPAEPEVGHDAWYRGWECSYDVDAALYGHEGWRAYKGGADLDARQTSGKTWSDLLDEIDEQEGAA